MTKQLFTETNLEEIKDAIVDVFTIFVDILNKPLSHYNDLRDRLEVVDAIKWESIRAKFLEEDYTGYSEGGFSAKEKLTVVKILFDMISVINKSTETVLMKLEEKCKDTMNMEDKVKILEGRIKSTESVMHSQEDFYKQKCSDNAELQAKLVQLQATVDEKNRKIKELEMDKNVHVWESEKKRLLKESEEKIQSLEAENEELKTTRENLKRRVTNLDETLKKTRMKSQLPDKHPSPLPSDNTGDNEKLSRTNFIQDKDIVYLEKQLYDLQTCTVGVIGGMKTDFSLMSGRFLIPEEGEYDPDFVKLRARMDQCYKQLADGEIEKTKVDLPAHYRYIENDNFKVRRIRRLSAPAVVPSQKVLKNIIEEKKSLPKLNGIEEAPANPVIVNPVTKRLHPINPLKYFGHMSQKFILDQYKEFTEFDRNGDMCLDLSEVVKVVTQLGFNFNAHQLQEAMEEVDRDHNHTLDFYEYLLIIDKIYTKSGKADLFKQGLKELKDKNISKSCAIQ